MTRFIPLDSDGSTRDALMYIHEYPRIRFGNLEWVRPHFRRWPHRRK